MQVDMHVHSNASFDSKMKVDILLRNLKSIGLDGIAITDHDTLEAIPKAKEIAKNYDVKVFSAVEITTKKGHIIAYGIQEKPPYRSSVEETLDWIKDQDGLSVCTHPFRISSPSLGDDIYNHTFDALEINAKCHLSQNSAAETAATVLKIPLIGGSDAHFLSSVGLINTSFEDEITNEDELISAIRKRRCEVMYKIPVSIKGELIPPIHEEELGIFDKILEKKKPVLPVIEASNEQVHFFDS